MNNAVSKVVFNSNVLIDLTQDTVAPETLAEGIIAHDNSGKRIEGTANVTSAPTAADTGKVWTAKGDGTAYWAEAGSTKVILKKWTTADMGG